MARLLAAALALILSTLATNASPWPAFPQHPDPVTSQEVKDFWYKALPRPAKPRPLDRDYRSKLNQYQYEVSVGRALIRRLLAGFYDHDAKLTALRHNLALYRAAGLELNIAETEAAIALMLSQRPAIGIASNPNHVHHQPEPEIVYIQIDDDSQNSNNCPPHQHRPSHRPKPPTTVQPHPFPVRPATTRPTQSRPTPVKPTPVRPTITRPTQSRPTPVKPTPVRPTITRPTQSRPTPVKPSPVRPPSSPSRGTRGFHR